MLVGTEVSRTFLPEPGVLAQLGGGIAGLCGVFLLRRRRMR